MIYITFEERGLRRQGFEIINSADNNSEKNEYTKCNIYCDALGFISVWASPLHGCFRFNFLGDLDPNKSTQGA